MAYDAKAVANYFLDLATQNNTRITPMKLQKLIFFAHGWHLALTDKPLIAEQVEAWQFGPVVPSIYHEFKHERNGAITSKAQELDFDSFEFVELEIPKEDEQARKIMERVWTTYGSLSAERLSDLTHLPNTPWDKARKLWGEDTRNIPISETDIGVYFKEQLEKNRARQEQGS